LLRNKKVDKIQLCLKTAASFVPFSCVHSHLRNIDCLIACTACLVCLISTVNSHSKRKKKKRSLLTIKTGASSGHITKLKQSILLRCLWLCDIPHYDYNMLITVGDSVFRVLSDIGLKNENVELCDIRLNPMLRMARALNPRVWRFLPLVDQQV
jgi:hypothetical protein